MSKNAPRRSSRGNNSKQIQRGVGFTNVTIVQAHNEELDVDILNESSGSEHVRGARKRASRSRVTRTSQKSPPAPSRPKSPVEDDGDEEAEWEKDLLERDYWEKVERRNFDKLQQRRKQEAAVEWLYGKRRTPEQILRAKETARFIEVNIFETLPKELLRKWKSLPIPPGTHVPHANPARKIPLVTPIFRPSSSVKGGGEAGTEVGCVDIGYNAIITKQYSDSFTRGYLKMEDFDYRATPRLRSRRGWASDADEPVETTNTKDETDEPVDIENDEEDEEQIVVDDDVNAESGGEELKAAGNRRFVLPSSVNKFFNLSEWLDEEKLLFREMYCGYGKDWAAVSAMMGHTKSPSALKHFFYDERRSWLLAPLIGLTDFPLEHDLIDTYDVDGVSTNCEMVVKVVRTVTAQSTEPAIVPCTAMFLAAPPPSFTRGTFAGIGILPESLNEGAGATTNGKRKRSDDNDDGIAPEPKRRSARIGKADESGAAADEPVRETIAASFAPNTAAFVWHRCQETPKGAWFEGTILSTRRAAKGKRTEYLVCLANTITDDAIWVGEDDLAESLDVRTEVWGHVPDFSAPVYPGGIQRPTRYHETARSASYAFPTVDELLVSASRLKMASVRKWAELEETSRDGPRDGEPILPYNPAYGDPSEMNDRTIAGGEFGSVFAACVNYVEPPISEALVPMYIRSRLTTVLQASAILIERLFSRLAKKAPSGENAFTAHQAKYCKLFLARRELRLVCRALYRLQCENARAHLDRVVETAASAADVRRQLLIATLVLRATRNYVLTIARDEFEIFCRKILRHHN